MSIVMDGKTYLVTDEAAKIGGYTSDYIGQLCRGKKIECRRVSGHWFVAADSLEKYVADTGSAEKQNSNIVTEKNTVASSSESQNTQDQQNIGGSFIRDGVAYITTAYAAESTGYTQDYIGQLSRSGDIKALKVGRRWFVGNISLLQHKKENDIVLVSKSNAGSNTLLAPEQPTPIAIHTPTQVSTPDTLKEMYTPIARDTTVARAINFNVKYTSETDSPILPILQNTERKDNTGYATHDMYNNVDSRLAEVGELPENNTIAEEDIPIPSIKTPYTAKALRKPINYLSREDVIERVEDHHEYIVRTKRTNGKSVPRRNVLLPLMLFLLLLTVLYASYILFINKEAFHKPSFGMQTPVSIKVFITRFSDTVYDILPGNTYIYTAKK